MIFIVSVILGSAGARSGSRSQRSWCGNQHVPVDRTPWQSVVPQECHRNINLIFQEKLSQSLRSLCQRTSCHSKMSPSSNVDVSRFSIVSRPFSVGTRKRHWSPLKTSRKPEMLMLIGQEPSSDCFKFQTKIHHSTMTTRIIISNPENEWT